MDVKDTSVEAGDNRGIHGAVAAALGQGPRFHHATLIPQVEAALAAEADKRNRHVVLAIDESHLLTSDQLEAVRMLTKHDLDSRSPLTILLIGQPTLRRRLRVGDMAALDQRVALRYHIPAPALTPPKPAGTSGGTSSTPAGPTPCSPTPSAPSTPTPAACPAPSTGSPSPRSWPPAPPARPSPTNPPPAPPSARKPPPRQTDHHRATPSTTSPARPPPGGLFTPARRHAHRRRNRHPERRLTPAVSPGQAPRDHRPERAASPRCLTPCQPVSPSSCTGPLSCHMFYYSIRNAKALPHRERALSCENSSGGGI